MYTKAVVAHGGGPTAVINASLAGLIEECRRRGSVLYGARYGLAGLVRGDLVDLLAFDADLVRRVGATPRSAAGAALYTGRGAGSPGSCAAIWWICWRSMRTWSAGSAKRPARRWDRAGFRSPTKTDRKSTRLNSSHLGISYAVFCLKKK